MKKSFIVLLALIMFFCSCDINRRDVTATNEPQVSDIKVSNTNEAVMKPAATDTPEASKASYPTGSNTEIISSIIKRMINNKETNSVEGFTDKSTYGDVLDKIGEDNIENAALSYNCELVGYPAVAKYGFVKNENDKLSLTIISLLVMSDPKNRYEEQLKKFIDKLTGIFGKPDENDDTHFYHWIGGLDNENVYGVSALTDDTYKSSGILAMVTAISREKSNIPNIFPYKFGTDINTVYKNEASDPKLEKSTEDPYTYLINNKADKETSINFCFIVEDSKIKLSKAEYKIDLLNTEPEDIQTCFKAIGDEMESAFGPAQSRKYNPKPSHSVYTEVLYMDWKGLIMDTSCNDYEDDPYITFDFSKEFFENK